MFEVSADLVALLQAWHEHLGQPKTNAPIIGDLGWRLQRDRSHNPCREVNKSA
jgi:hypothetical protein